MTIQNELNKIKTAVLGKDVRTAIHDSIEKTYNDATESGNANMEVEMARGTHPTLNKRLTLSEQEIEVEKKRIDNLAKLGEGSTTGDAELIDARIGADGVTYVNAGGAIRGQIDKINNDLVSHKEDYETRISFKKTGKNLFDKTKITTGFYVNHENGNLLPAGTTSVSAYIPVIVGGTYTETIFDGTDRPIEQSAFYDINKNYVSGLTHAGKTRSSTFVIPENVAFLRLTLITARQDIFQFEKGDTTSYEPYKMSVAVADIEKGKLTTEYFDSETLSELNINKNIIKVKTDGSGDYTNLRLALESITNANKNNPYQVHIYPGIYNVMSYYSQAEINNTSFLGLIKPDYVSLIGIGEPDEIVIKGDLVDGVHSSTTMTRVSTLVRYGNGDMQNLKVTARNLRYAVHDDYSFPDSIGYTKNCKFYKYKSDVFTNFPSAYGAGVFTGMKRYFEDCYTYTDQASYSLSFHNNISFLRPSELKFINCEFDNKGSTTAINFGSMGSGKRDKITMTGCRLKGKLQLNEGIAGVGCDFDLTGSNNDKVPYAITSTNNGQYVYNFVGEHLRVHNSDVSIISKGTPVKFSLVSNNSGVKSLSLTDNQSILLGIASQDINVGESGIIRIDGYLNISDTKLIGIVDGDKVGIVNGTLAKITTGEHIGVVVWGGWVKLKF